MKKSHLIFTLIFLLNSVFATTVHAMPGNFFVLTDDMILKTAMVGGALLMGTVAIGAGCLACQECGHNNNSGNKNKNAQNEQKIEDYWRRQQKQAYEERRQEAQKADQLLQAQLHTQREREQEERKQALRQQNARIEQQITAEQAAQKKHQSGKTKRK